MLPIILLLAILTLIPHKTTSTNCLISPPYTNITLVELEPTSDEIESLTQLLQTHCELRSITVSPLQPDHRNLILATSSQLETLHQHATPHHIHTNDLSTAIAAWPSQQPTPSTVRTTTKTLDEQFYMQYRTYDALQTKQRQLVADFPGIITRRLLGRSHEGRRIDAFTFGATSRDNPRRVLITGLLHAREWVATMVPHYLMEYICVSVAADDSFLNGTEVVVIPLVNPDGYVYSGTTDRLWRKNRRADTGCAVDRDGVDLNRNWDLDFGGVQSTSRDGCSDVFIGAEAFSEPETSAVARFIARRNVTAHVDMHAFGQLVLGAWGFTDEVPPRVQMVDDVGIRLAQRMSESSSGYSFGRGDSAPVGLASGTFQDWTFRNGALSFTIELRPSSGGGFEGFLLAEDMLIEASLDGVAALQVLMEFVASTTPGQF